ncbi:MAG TPA: hypothetical protein PKW92_11545 [Smithella sp.]|nr:hypothetical protein [Smithella sp.]
MRCRSVVYRSRIGRGRCRNRNGCYDTCNGNPCCNRTSANARRRKTTGSSTRCTCTCTRCTCTCTCASTSTCTCTCACACLTKCHRRNKCHQAENHCHHSNKIHQLFHFIPLQFPKLFNYFFS